MPHWSQSQREDSKRRVLALVTLGRPGDVPLACRALLALLADPMGERNWAGLARVFPGRGRLLLILEVNFISRSYRPAK
jgi:hypothetical protein